MQSDLGARSLVPKIGIPLERKILDAVPVRAGSKPERPACEIEEMFFAQNSIVQFEHDEVSHSGNFADGFACALTILRVSKLCERHPAADQAK